MKRLVLFYFLIICFVVGQTQTVAKQKTIVFIGAHPDDETAVSEVLSKYAKQGSKVFVLIATDGKNGTRVTDIPAGDSLGNLRKKETICSCEKLGIQPPIFLSVERLDTKIGVANYFKCHRQLLDSLRIRIPMLQPDIIITFGPDGDTHHAEHIVVSGAVTELLLAEGWTDRYPLYYAAWQKDKTGENALGYVDSQYLNVQVEYTKEDKVKAIEALKCYKTQYTEDEIKKETANKIKDTADVLYFRRFVAQKGLQNEF
jgi:N-acetylglucosamine malate deacetylase 2